METEDEHRGNAHQIRSYDDFPTVLFPLLHHIGPNLYNDVPLLATILRLFKEYVTMQLGDQSLDTPAFRSTEHVIKRVLLPAISLLNINPAIVHEMWEVLQPLPYEIRYRIYHYWFTKAYSAHPGLAFTKVRTVAETKRVLRYDSPLSLSLALSIIQAPKLSVFHCMAIADWPRRTSNHSVAFSERSRIAIRS